MPDTRPSSRCIAYSHFEFISPTPATRPDKRRPGSLGYVQVIFRRKFPAYNYWLAQPMRWDEWQKFLRASSVGRYWNYKVKGQYG